MNVNTGFQNHCLIATFPVLPASVFYLRWWQNDSSKTAPLALFLTASLSQDAGQKSEFHAMLQTGKNEPTEQVINIDVHKCALDKRTHCKVNCWLSHHLQNYEHEFSYYHF